MTGTPISFPFLWNLTVDPPTFFTVFGYRVYFYGVIIACGFLLGILFCSKKSSEFGIAEDDFYSLVLWLMPGSIIGARLYYVLFKLDYYLVHPDELFAIREGGLAIYGGVIFGIIILILFCRKKKISIPAFIDLLVFGLLIGQILGRWGNFFNREAFGEETAIFCRMGLTYPDGSTIFVHPTFLYESLWNLVCFIFLLLFVNKRKRRFDGQCALIYFCWYGFGRFWIEGLRTDSLYIGGTGIRVSQLLSALIFAVALFLLIRNSRKEHCSADLYVNSMKEAAAEKEAYEETDADSISSSEDA